MPQPTLLVYLDGGYFPKSIFEVFRVFGNVLLASGRFRRALGIGVPSLVIASPLTTEGRVDNNVVVEKEGVNLATGAPSEERHGLAPGLRVWDAQPKIIWQTATREEPHSNMLRSPLKSVDTSLHTVESITVGVFACYSLLASSLGVASAAVASVEHGGSERAHV